MIVTEQEHKWQRGSTNEYCIHCGLIFESDLGWTSADGVKCKERTFEVSDLEGMPSKLKDYSRWKGLNWNDKEKVFIKPYSCDTYTVDQLNNELISI